MTLFSTILASTFDGSAADAWGSVDSLASSLQKRYSGATVCDDSSYSRESAASSFISARRRGPKVLTAFCCKLPDGKCCDAKGETDTCSGQLLSQACPSAGKCSQGSEGECPKEG
ncbi:unnamed protein product [Amoebophrya sp. A25]|nr:unnamed protein product [Amoebophrya sp. A25]|eukprot:GSA25T00015041001.1